MTAAQQNGDGPASAGSSSRTVTLGNREVTLERMSARKASRAIALIRALTKAVPQLQSELAAFRRQYETENVIELDRVQARLQFPTRLLINDEGEPVFEPAEVNGEPNPRAGEPMLVPSPIDRLTEQDWAEAGGKWRRPVSPSTQEIALALLDSALELAEDHVYRLLALFLMSNADVKAEWNAGTLAEGLERRAGELLDDAYGDELLELAVVVGELVDSQFVTKARGLGERLGNLGRLVGLELPTSQSPTSSTSSETPASSTPTSSTPSPPDTADGAPTPSSTPPGTSSSSSEDASRPTLSEPTPMLQEAPAA